MSQTNFYGKYQSLFCWHGCSAPRGKENWNYYYIFYFTIREEHINTFSFLYLLGNMRGKVAEHFVDHVMEGGKILVHGESRVVQEALCHAAKSGKDFEVS